MVQDYDGESETIGLFGIMPCGNSHIITQYAETVLRIYEGKGFSQEEIKKFVKKIKYNV